MTQVSNTSHRSFLLAGLGGVAAAVFGLGVAELVVARSSRFQSPVISVGDRVVDNVPSWAKDVAIELFGTKDKVALLVGIGLILAGYAALLGIWSRSGRVHRVGIGLALFAALGGLSATFTRTGTNSVGWIPTFVGSVAVGLALVFLARLGRDRAPVANPKEFHPSERRRVLAGIGMFGVAGATGIALGRNSEGASAGTVSRSLNELPIAKNPLAQLPDTIQAPSADPFFTPNTDFYRIDTALVAPQVNVDDWALRIHGLVDDELVLTYADLRDREIVESDITLTCVSNTIGGRFVGTARWTGIRLDDLLDDIGVDPSADQIVGRSVDGYTCGFPVASLDGRDALIAIGMNGELLPVEHGFPARLIVPGLYGYVSATKWLTEIELTTFDSFDHYWVPRGYAVEAPIKMQSRIDTPRGLDQLDAGPFVIGGVAWAQPVGIASVELSIDEGEWIEATLADEVNGSTWRQWSHEWEATPGRHSITVRAKDQKGAIQTSERSEPLPDGASGHHTVVVLVT